MGYTHYIRRLPELDPAKWSAWTSDVGEILATPSARKIDLLRESDEPDSEPDVTDDVVQFNGAGRLGHETFVVERVFVPSFRQEMVQQEMDGRLFQFCKTQQKPYDAVVCACLIALKARFGDDVVVSSDGGWDDWAPGRVIHGDAAIGETVCPFTPSADD